MELTNKEDMRRFYENEMRIRWEYEDPPPPRPCRYRDRALCSGPARPWVYNLAGFHKKVLAGKADAGWRQIDGARAPLLVLDVARQLSFLFDPRYSREAVEGLAGERARKRRVAGALARSDRFLALVDAYLIGNAAGHERYRRRAEKRDKGYFAAMLEDLEELVDTGRVKPLVREDLPQLRRIVAADVDSESGLALLDWMRGKAVDLVAHTAPYWKHVRYEGHRGILREAAAVAQANAADMLVPLLLPPFVAGEGGLRTLETAEYREALLGAVDKVREERAAVAAAQTTFREKALDDLADAVLDESARDRLAASIGKALEPTDPARSWAARLGVGRWVLAAETAGS
jgi:hypothetical protein